MIRTEREYLLARRQVEEGRQRIEENRISLEQEGLTPDEVKRLLNPSLYFYGQTADEVQTYERARRRDFGTLPFSDFGRLLISLRVASGLSQRELAERLGVHESVVSRDERNDYHGVTVERAQRIIGALGEEVVLTVRPRQSKGTPARRARDGAAAIKRRA